jgi:hypothetical protein
MTAVDPKGRQCFMRCSGEGIVHDLLLDLGCDMAGR